MKRKTIFGCILTGFAVIALAAAPVAHAGTNCDNSTPTISGTPIGSANVPLPTGAGQQLVVTSSWTQGAPEADDLTPGKHVFRMKDGKLAKVAE